MREPLSDRVGHRRPGRDARGHRGVAGHGHDVRRGGVAPRQISAFGGVTVGGAAFRLTDILVVDGE